MVKVHIQIVFARFNRQIDTEAVINLYCQKEESLSYKMDVKNYFYLIKIGDRISDFRRQMAPKSTHFDLSCLKIS